jgi:hypothetical protein
MFSELRGIGLDQQGERTPCLVKKDIRPVGSNSERYDAAPRSATRSVMTFSAISLRLATSSFFRRPPTRPFGQARGETSGSPLADHRAFEFGPARGTFDRNLYADIHEQIGLVDLGTRSVVVAMIFLPGAALGERAAS